MTLAGDGESARTDDDAALARGPPRRRPGRVRRAVPPPPGPPLGRGPAHHRQPRGRRRRPPGRADLRLPARGLLPWRRGRHDLAAPDRGQRLASTGCGAGRCGPPTRCPTTSRSAPPRGAVLAGPDRDADPGPEAHVVAGERAAPGAGRARGAPARPEGGAGAGRHGGLSRRRGGRDPRGRRAARSRAAAPAGGPGSRYCSRTWRPPGTGTTAADAASHPGDAAGAPGPPAGTRPATRLPQASTGQARSHRTTATQDAGRR